MGFIGIDRGIIKHWIYEDAEYFKVWFEIIYRARFSFEPEKKLIDGKHVTIEYGQFIFGRTSWSDRLKVSEQRLRTLFTKLKKDGMIEVVQQLPKCTIYSVINYEKYNQQSNHLGDLDTQVFSSVTNHQINRTSTTYQPSINQLPTTQEQRSNKDEEFKRTTTTNAYAIFDREGFGDCEQEQSAIAQLIRTYGNARVCKALQEASSENVKELDHVKTILERYKIGA